LRCFGCRYACLLRKAQEFPTEGDFLLPVAVGQESVIADSHEAFGEHVKKEAAKEFYAIESHGVLAVPVAVVLPPEADVPVFQSDEALVGDGDPVGVAGQVLEDLLGPSERGLGVDHPLVPVERGEKPHPLPLVRQGPQLSMKGKRPLLVCLVEIGEELLLEKAAEDAYGQEEAVATGNPTLPI
jgi:hypothetical protein